MSALPYVYFEEKIVPHEQAKISIMSNSLQYGTTCFAGIRGFLKDGKARVFRLEDHYIRLMNASKILNMQYFITFQEFENIILELIRKNNPQSDFYIRPFLFSQTPQIAPKLKGLKFELAIYLIPLGHYFDPNRGLRLMTSSWRKFSDQALPTKAKAGGCYVNSVLATSDANQAGFDDALMVNEQGYIVEASVANILLVYRDRLIMPSVGSALLEGITMRTVIELLEEDGLKICYENIDRSMIYSCNELLLMGTAAQISFVESVDNRLIGPYQMPEAGIQPGLICKLLRNKIESVINKAHPKAQKWILEV